MIALSLSLLIGVMALVLLFWVRSILLVVAQSLRTRGYSDLLITDVTVALPIALGIVFLAIAMAWVSQ